jgi:hypothetical protein
LKIAPGIYNVLVSTVNFGIIHSKVENGTHTKGKMCIGSILSNPEILCLIHRETSAGE